MTHLQIRPVRHEDARALAEVHARTWEEAWGSCLAVELMLAGEQALRELGYSHATLWVLRDNPRARAFYEKQDWRIDSSEKDYVAGVVEVRYEREL